VLDDTRAPHPADTPQRVQRLVDRGERGEAVKAFMRLLGLPAPFTGLMRVLPAWKKMTGIAQTHMVKPKVTAPGLTGFLVA
jgi:hypothetical protein